MGCLQVLRGTFKIKLRLARARGIWGDSIRIDLKEIGINTRDSVDSEYDRLYWRIFGIAALNLGVQYATEFVI